MGFVGSCKIVPFLKAPGFCKVGTESYFHTDKFADISSYIDGTINLKVKSTTPKYAGFRIAFGAKDIPRKTHGPGSFKSGFTLKDTEDWQTVSIPFSSFSYDWSEFTGRCDTKDPTGVQHHCCGTGEDAKYCPNAENLKEIDFLEIWSEGIEGDYSLEIASISAATSKNEPLPTQSRCQELCPKCDAPDCECNDACWPGSDLNTTSDKTCECFAELPFCKAGEEPVYTPGKKCPTCWPPENKACMCFAAIGFCEPPKTLPTTSACSTICPGCTSTDCECPKGACWPGKSLNATRDHTCDCFAKLGFCKPGEKPVYNGGECPSCWDPDNKACDCFAVLGFCDN